MSRHPQHDAVAAEVASWYTRSAPAMGYELEQRWCGLFTTPTSRIGPRVILRLSEPGSLADALTEVREVFGGFEVEVWVEGREATDALDLGLRAGGCEPEARTVYLALVGEVQAAPAPRELEIEVVTTETLPEWVTVQHQGFAGDDVAPDAATVEHQVELRGIEITDIGRLWLARLDGEPVAGMAFYDGDDRLVNSLATRLPFRGKGIARALLTAFVADSEQAGCRSAMINADADDWPVQLYRRMGFQDEVLFHARYRLGA